MPLVSATIYEVSPRRMATWPSDMAQNYFQAYTWQASHCHSRYWREKALLHGSRDRVELTSSPSGIVELQEGALGELAHNAHP